MVTALTLEPGVILSQALPLLGSVTLGKLLNSQPLVSCA